MRGDRKIDPVEIGTWLITWAGLAVFIYYVLEGYLFG